MGSSSTKDACCCSREATLRLWSSARAPPKVQQTADDAKDEITSQVSYESFGEEPAPKNLDEEEAELAKIRAMREQGKRPSVCSDTVSRVDLDNFVKPVYPKSADVAAELHRILKENDKMQVLCGALNAAALHDIVNAFELQEVPNGTEVIKQGDDGDYLYVCLGGNLDIFVARPGPDGKFSSAERGAKVMSVGVGALFGELALMYRAPRAATVVVTSATAKLGRLHQKAFKVLVMQSSEAQFRMYEGWLREVELLKPFNHHELSLLADSMETSLFDADEEIITQGEPGDAFYIVEDGTCSAYISGADGEKEVKAYETGGYFGEIALLTDEPRKASVRATGEGCAVVSVSKEGFTNLFGPIREQLEKDISQYPKYASFLTGLS